MVLSIMLILVYKFAGGDVNTKSRTALVLANNLLLY